MKLWIVRDEGTRYCRLFLDKPYKTYDDFFKKHCWRTDDMMGTYMCLPSSEFTDVTFENSPKEVEIKLTEINL